jgi:hypothetical protein
MDESTNSPGAPPIDDVKPTIPDATSTGAEFSEDFGPEPFPSKDTIQAMKKQPVDTVQETVATSNSSPTDNQTQNAESQEESVPQSSEAPIAATSETDENIAEITQPPESEPTDSSADGSIVADTAEPALQLDSQQITDDQTIEHAKQPAVEIKDHGTHRSMPRTGNGWLAGLIGFVGISLCALVVFVYISTN